uniref:Vacuolar protein sorting-associated protein 18 homolog n=1 Tax=Caenorhabditis japonica TaxID=281687 RepID=A0A8R1DT93_CAEJA
MIPSTTKNKNGIFTRTTFDMKKDLKFLKLTSATNLAVQNGEMLVAANEKLLIHYSDERKERPQEMTLPLQPPDHVAHIHLSPTGFHAIVSSKLGHNFYVNLTTNTVHHIKKIRAVITAVGWNPEYAKETETGPILLGTAQGSIIEMHMMSAGYHTTCKELIQQVAQFADQRLTSSPTIAAAVSDIKLFTLLDEDSKAKKWMLIVAQMSRLIVLVSEIEGEKPVFKTGGFTSSASLQAGLMNLGAEQAPPTFFHTFFTSTSTAVHTISAKLSEKFKNHGFLTMHPSREDPKRYAWLSPDGISIGKVDIYAERVQDVLLEEVNIEHRLIEGRLEPPTGIALTDYHILLVYSSRLLALSLLPPHDVVFEDPWNPELGSAIGFVSDVNTNFLWLYTPTIAMKYGTNDEARYIWKVYLDRGDYQRALQIARSRVKIEPDALEIVLRKQADFYIHEKNYTAAAEILAQSSEPFESVVLKFLTNSSERKMGLKTLLDKKLERLTRHEDKIRRDALVMWLLNVQLEELAEMRRLKSSSSEASFATALKDTTDHVQRYFMRKNVFESIQTNREAVYRMCVAHADFEMQLFFANAVKDIRSVIDILMLREQYIEVLDVLKYQRVSELTYEMAPLLIEQIPKQVIGYFIQNQDQILPQKLTPCLSLCVKNIEMAIPAIKYLEVIFKTHKNINNLHNIYIHLMAKFRPEKLLFYLEDHGTIRADIPYDLDFAMRTCEQFKIERCVVFLYCVAGMFSDAVEKALVFDVELAKRYALMIDEAEANFVWLEGLEEASYIRQKLDEKAKKAIWLKIASYYVSQEEKNVAKCIEVINESNNLITIQDLLPIIPKFTKVGELKQVIVDFLQRNKDRLEKLEKSMKEATDIALEIREKQEKLKNRTTVVKPSDVCAHCQRPISGRAFNVHSCRHFFHRECLESAMIPFLSPENVARMRMLIVDEERVLVQMRAEQLAGNRAAYLEKQEKYLRIASFISHIVGAECPLCGNIAISQIDKQFLSDEEYAVDLNSWLL